MKLVNNLKLKRGLKKMNTVNLIVNEKIGSIVAYVMNKGFNPCELIRGGKKEYFFEKNNKHYKINKVIGSDNYILKIILNEIDV